MKLHALILRLLVLLGVAAFTASECWQFTHAADSVAIWGYWLGEMLCLILLFMTPPAARLLGAGGLFGIMLSNALFALHDMTGFFPTHGSPDEPLRLLILQSFLALLLVTATAALVIWEVYQLKHPKPPADPEEPEFTRNPAWDESRPQ